MVATVLTACGIETVRRLVKSYTIPSKLQQCLPLAVLKLIDNLRHHRSIRLLQQCLPLAVLKLGGTTKNFWCGLLYTLQQCLPLAVCDEGGEIAEKRR